MLRLGTDSNTHSVIIPSQVVRCTKIRVYLSLYINKADIEFLVKMGPYHALPARLIGATMDRGPEYIIGIDHDGKGGRTL